MSTKKNKIIEQLLKRLDGDDDDEVKGDPFSKEQKQSRLLSSKLKGKITTLEDFIIELREAVANQIRVGKDPYEMTPEVERLLDTLQQDIVRKASMVRIPEPTTMSESLQLVSKKQVEKINTHNAYERNLVNHLMKWMREYDAAIDVSRKKLEQKKSQVRSVCDEWRKKCSGEEKIRKEKEKIQKKIRKLMVLFEKAVKDDPHTDVQYDKGSLSSMIRNYIHAVQPCQGKELIQKLENLRDVYDGTCRRIKELRKEDDATDPTDQVTRELIKREMQKRDSCRRRMIKLEEAMMMEGGEITHDDDPVLKKRISVLKKLHSKARMLEMKEKEVELVVWRLLTTVAEEEEATILDIDADYSSWISDLHKEKKKEYDSTFRKMSQMHNKRISELEHDSKFLSRNLQATPQELMNMALFWKNLLLKEEESARRDILVQLRSLFRKPKTD